MTSSSIPVETFSGMGMELGPLDVLVRGFGNQPGRSTSICASYRDYKDHKNNRTSEIGLSKYHITIYNIA
jgi:hypothetical protein